MSVSPVQEQTLLDYLLEAAANQPDQTLIETDNRCVTRKQFYQQVLGLADVLRKKGLTSGCRVAFLTDENFECYLALFAIWAAGCVAVPLNPTLPEGQLQQLLSRSSPKHVLVGGRQSNTLKDIVTSTSFAEIPSNSSKEQYVIKPRWFDQAIIMFTSGTTGIPKGVQNTHETILRNSIETAKRLKLTAGDKLLINTPAYFTSGIIHFATVLVAGGSLYSKTGFLFASDFANLVVKHRLTGFGGAPAHLGRLFGGSPEFSLPDYFRFIMSSGDHLPVALIQNIRHYFPTLQIFVVYGLSEVAGRLCILPAEKIVEKEGAVGHPICDMKINICRDETYELCLPGEIGEIYVSGPLLTGGYLNDPVASRVLHTPYGFRTGDRGWLDQEGCLFVTGRIDDVFKCGGEKVSTYAISDAVRAVASFADFAVIGEKDDSMGTVPALYYVLQLGEPFVKSTFLAALRRSLPNSHLPRRYYEVVEIPRTGSGKVIKSKLYALAIPTEN